MRTRLPPIPLMIVLPVVLVPTGHFMFFGFLFLFGYLVDARRFGLLQLRIQIFI